MAELQKMIRIVFFFLICFDVGAINSAEPTSNIEKKQFRFLINADPQVGAKNTKKNSLNIRNELLEKFVKEVNEENEISPIEFVIYNGDLVNNAFQESFDNFTKTVSNQKVPILLVHGNHDGHDDDPKYFNAQQKLSGFKKLNYSFEYGDWYFIIIGAQQKYKTDQEKQTQLTWLNNELLKAKSKQVMLFMHYHIMPVGLSQMEYYTYWPIEFKNEILDLITKYGNVKYVFTGHVHAGVKASIKSSLEYKDVKFINCPTSAKARPFGEEFKEYEQNKDSFFRTGFYLDVRIKGNKVELIGRKISNNNKVKYPITFYKFNKNFDIRFFIPESQLRANKELLNTDFSKGFDNWRKSFRYQKDVNSSFINVIEEGKNILILNAPWGGWSQDEYMESYQVFKLDISKENILAYKFLKPEFSSKGAGGYIKLVLYSDDKDLHNIVLFHWGNNENVVKTMHKSWFYNITGHRPRKISTKINDLILNKKMFSFPLNFDESNAQLLEVNINKIILEMSKYKSNNKFNKMSVSHGVWTRTVSDNEKLFSKLIVDEVKMSSIKEGELNFIHLNKKNITLSESDKNSPYKGDVKLAVRKLQ